MEEWRDIKGYEGIYQVSSEGRIKSLNREVLGKSSSIRFIKGVVMRPSSNNRGYLMTSLHKNGSVTHKLVHRLVYEAFVGEIPSDKQVNHINEVKTDNRLCNLNLMTCKENNNWGTRNERATTKLTNRNDVSKAVFGYDKDGNLVVSFPSTNEARRNGYSQGHVAACARGERKTHKGLKWSYNKL